MALHLEDKIMHRSDSDMGLQMLCSLSWWGWLEFSCKADTAVSSEPDVLEAAETGNAAELVILMLIAWSKSLVK